MYELAIKRDFVAQHYLTSQPGGSAEHARHSHHYAVELRLEGAALDHDGYLVDILAVAACLDAVINDYRDRTLNDLPEFAGLNPSLEHFCRILAVRLNDCIRAPNVALLTVRLWETPAAWAAYRLERGSQPR